MGDLDDLFDRQGAAREVLAGEEDDGGGAVVERARQFGWIRRAIAGLGAGGADLDELDADLAHGEVVAVAL